MTKLKSLASTVGQSTEGARRNATAPLKLLVRVVEARGLPAIHLNGTSDPFVKLQLGKRRAKTAVIKKNLCPVWDEFSFLLGTAADNDSTAHPKSDFWPAVAELQGTSGFQIESWKLDSNDGCLRRTLTYIKAASKLVKAVKTTEEQKYLKAAASSFAVLSIVSTPDVPCGNCFKTEILYCITPGPQLSSEEQTTHLTVSWRINFVQSTMMKGMIESGAKQGMSEGYAQFSEVCCKSECTIF